jgi:uncharacterized integral membrane protein
MEGYGRYLLLFLFIAFAVAVNYDEIKKNKWCLLYPVAIIILSSIVIGIAYFIWNYW